MKNYLPSLVTVGVLFTFALLAACGGTASTNSNQAAPTSAPAAQQQATSVPAQTNAPLGIVTATPESNSDAAPASTIAFTKINLNTATADQILTIPNTGSRMVREFQEYRPYTSITQFRREIGKYVDAATVAEYEKYVYVPINVNQSDAATLQQIPGITADIAAQLISARPYGTNQNFLAKLVTFISADQVTFAQNYLQ